MQTAGDKIFCENSPVLICSVYFLPRYTVTYNLYNKYIIGRDFNARLTNPKGKELNKSMMNNNCNAISSGSPTHWTSDPTKIPDLLDFFIFKVLPRSVVVIKAYNDLSSDPNSIIFNYSTLLTR